MLLFYIALSVFWGVMIHYRLSSLEAEVNSRTIYVEKILDLEVRVLRLEKDQATILQHHLDLLEDTKNEQQ